MKYQTWLLKRVHKTHNTIDVTLVNEITNESTQSLQKGKGFRKNNKEVQKDVLTWETHINQAKVASVKCEAALRVTARQET